MKKSKRLLGIAAAGLIGAGSLFSGVAVTGILQQAEVFAATDVAINATNFPDAAFRTYVADNFDSNKDGRLSNKECSAVNSLLLNEAEDNIRRKITNLKGIEFFTELSLFRIYDSEKLSNLDTGKNAKLSTLHVWNEYGNSNIKEINVGKNVTNLDLWWSNVDSLNISECTKLDNFLTGTLKNLTMRNNQEIVVLFNSKEDGKIQATIDDTKIVKLGDSVECSRGYGDFKLICKSPGTTTVTVTRGGKPFQKFDVTVKGDKTKAGWKNENGGWKYYKNGVAYKGWHKMGKAEGEKTEHWSYFGKDGKIYTGWRKMGKNEGEKTEHWSYFGDNGWLRTGWQSMGKGTKNPDGNAAKHVSYFGDNGWLRTGWQQMGKGTKNPDGNTAKHWSYFGSNGWLRTGMVTLGKADGEKITHKSYFGNNGWLVTSKRFSVAGRTYTADGRGWIK